MALYKEVDYCTEEVRSVASPVGFGRNVGGVQQYVVKETFEEVDQVPRVGHGHRHGNHGHGGAVRQYVVKETFEEVDQVPHVGGRNHGHHQGNRGHHGHGGFGNHFEARETKFEENINTGTGEFHERKENFLVRN